MARKTASSATGMPLLLAVAFTGGWVIMQLEILGGRLLAPYFGYSVYQWGALIGVVMAALALGYHLGGRIGDRPVAGRFLLVAFTVSAVFVVIVPQYPDVYMPGLRAFGPAWGAVVASTVLLGLPSILLATTSPIVIRMTATSRIANSAGRVYALSTVGSIGGTFFTTFYVIPEMGTRTGHYVAALLIAAAAAGLAWHVRKYRFLAAAAAVAVLGFPFPRELPPTVIHSAESLHNIIRVEELGRFRYLYLNYTEGPQTIMNKESLLTGSYYDRFLVGPHLTGGRKILFLGVAGGTSLRQLAELYPDVSVTGVELDPEVIDVARKYFGLADYPDVELVADDARWFLANSETTYDIIAIDLYVTGHIPFFTTTREFFALAADRLEPDGLLMMNILAPRDPQDMLGPFVRTVRTAFPSTFLIGQGNYILLATKQVTSSTELARAMARPSDIPEIEVVLRRARETLRPASASADVPIFTDDRNDVEFRTFRSFYGG